MKAWHQIETKELQREKVMQRGSDRLFCSMGITRGLFLKFGDSLGY